MADQRLTRCSEAVSIFLFSISCQGMRLATTHQLVANLAQLIVQR
jgi:hypothetical protein